MQFQSSNTGWTPTAVSTQQSLAFDFLNFTFLMEKVVMWFLLSVAGVMAAIWIAFWNGQLCFMATDKLLKPLEEVWMGR